MEAFILIAIIAYLLFAINGVIDKFLLRKDIPEPATFAFYVGILSGLAILLAPFGMTLPSFKVTLVALISGALFVYALVTLYKSLKHADASLVFPSVGAMVPVVTLLTSAVIIGEALTTRSVWGIIFLALGSLLLGLAYGKATKNKWIGYSVLAAILFAFSFTLAKYVYLTEPFISGLIWTRIGSVTGALTLLLIPGVFAKITNTTNKISQPKGALFMSGQVIGAGAGILQNYAVALGSVTIVNALQGTQFALLFLLTWALSVWFPKVLKEDISATSLLKKIAAIVVVLIGLILVA